VTAYLDDPLRDVTRKKRRALLIATVLGFTIAVIGLTPKSIQVVGIAEFTPPNERNLLLFLAAIISYYLLGFNIYSRTDLKNWEIKIEKEVHQDRIKASDDVILKPERDARYESASRDISRKAELQRVLIGQEIEERIRMKIIEAKFMSSSRQIYDYWIPVVAAVGTIIALLYKAFF
jgi:hypothetical protein